MGTVTLSFRAKSRLQRSPESFRSEARLSIPLRQVEVVPRGTSPPLRSAEDDAIKLASGETAVDVTLQMGNGCLLAGNHMFHEVADRDHADHFIVVNDRQMADMVICHETQTCFDSLAPICCEHIR